MADAPQYRQLLKEVLDAHEDYARSHMAETNAISNYSGNTEKYSRATLSAMQRCSNAEKAARAALSAPLSPNSNEGHLTERFGERSDAYGVTVLKEICHIDRCGLTMCAEAKACMRAMDKLGISPFSALEFIKTDEELMLYHKACVELGRQEERAALGLPAAEALGSDVPEKPEAAVQVPQAPLPSPSIAHRLFNVQASIAEDEIWNWLETIYPDCCGDIGSDPYDGSIELYGAKNDMALTEAQRSWLWANGFSRIWINHEDMTQTYYSHDGAGTRYAQAEHRKKWVAESAEKRDRIAEMRARAEKAEVALAEALRPDEKGNGAAPLSDSQEAILQRKFAQSHTVGAPADSLSNLTARFLSAPLRATWRFMRERVDWEGVVAMVCLALLFAGGVFYWALALQVQ